MAEKSCRVTVADMNGTAHTVQITASSLFEAVAPGLTAIRGNDWVVGIAQGLNTVEVSVTSVPVEHEVMMKHSLDWLERRGNSPRDVADRSGSGLFWDAVHSSSGIARIKT